MQHNQGNQTNVGQNSTALDVVNQQAQGAGQQAPQPQAPNGRQDIGGTTATIVNPITARVNFEQVGRSAGGNRWYLDMNDPDLAVVTAEAQNEALGITRIMIFQPSQNQLGQGIVCKAVVETPLVKITNLSIRESKERDGSIYIQVPGREWIPTSGENQGKKQWFHDIEISKAGKAQILRYVDSLLVPANVPQQ